jgi:hypothetical protein
VYGVPEDELASVVVLAHDRGASTVFVTDGDLPNPWDRLPPGWPGATTDDR